MTTLKVNVVRRPSIKVKVLPNFPSSVTAISPILISRVGGNYAFSFDLNSIIAGIISTVSAAMALLFAPLASPAFTGVPTAPTASVGNNTNQIATDAFVIAQIAATTPANLQPLGSLLGGL